MHGKLRQCLRFVAFRSQFTSNRACRLRSMERMRLPQAFSPATEMADDLTTKACCQERLLRAQVADAYEAVSLQGHEDLLREILVEVSLLSERYRTVRRHDVPHVKEIAGLLDVLWQEIEMVQAAPRGLLDQEKAFALAAE